MNNFVFGLGESLVISRSGEIGKVAGRAEYITSEPSYLLKYTDTQGSAKSDWFNESELNRLLDPK